MSPLSLSVTASRGGPSIETVQAFCQMRLVLLTVTVDYLTALMSLMT